MKKVVTLSLFLTLIVISASAQNTPVISGVVKETNQKAVQSATVSVHNVSDSSVVKFTVSGKDGSYAFYLVKPGKYFISVSSVGFEKSFTPAFELAEQPVTMETVSLQEASKALGGVTVTSKRPFIETRIDKTIVNVDASPTNAGATAMEVLEKSPGVSVNNDGIISLRGKSGVIVMMDGKPTFLSPTDLANLLKNLPASAIDQIEIMTNPSSKYDAEGNSGVINIKTKKGKVAGFNGTAMVGITTGWYEQNGALYVIPKSQNSFTFNYRKNKINLFGNYNPNINRGRSHLKINREVVDNNGNLKYVNDVETKFKFGNNNHTLKLGMDYMPNNNTSFGFVLSGFQFSGHPTPVTITKQLDPNYNLLTRMVSKTENDLTFQNFTSNLNFRRQFDTVGRELTADFDFIAYDNTSEMTLGTNFFDANDQTSSAPLLLKGHLPSNIKIYSLKSDYVHPFRKGGRIEAGAKSSFVSNNNLVDYQRLVNDKWVADARSNHFIYDENINAVYLNANTQIKKWSFQGGLRLENTISKGYQVTNDSSFKRNFTSLFPSAFVSYEADKSNKFTVSFTRRITRPNYQDLNPFIYFLDSLSYRKGNPFLLPQFTQNIEFSYSYKGKLITTFNYNNTDDVISQILKPQNELVYLTVENVAKFRNIGLSITAPFPVTKWWNANMFANVYNNHYTGIYNNEPLDIAFTSFMVNMTHTFTIRQGFTTEVSGFYRAKGVDQLSINDPMYVVSFGASKTIMKGKGTLRLNLRDPFWIQKYSGGSDYGNINVRVSNRWDNRQVTTSFTYRFGKNGQNNQPRRRNNAGPEEANRVGTGG